MASDTYNKERGTGIKRRLFRNFINDFGTILSESVPRRGDKSQETQSKGKLQLHRSTTFCPFF
jgi:hypothetical protein